jgi:hypothetical protein
MARLLVVTFETLKQFPQKSGTLCKNNRIKVLDW